MDSLYYLKYHYIFITTQKQMKEKRRKYMISIIAAILLIVWYVIFAVPFEYKVNHAYCENSTDTYVEYYIGEESYNDTEKYNKTEGNYSEGTKIYM